MEVAIGHTTNELLSEIDVGQFSEKLFGHKNTYSNNEFEILLQEDEDDECKDEIENARYAVKIVLVRTA